MWHVVDELITYHEALIADLAGRADPDLAPFIAALKRIEMGGLQRGPRPTLDHPAMAQLERTLANVDPTVAAAARELDWSQVFAGGGIEPTLAEGMLAAQFAGSYGRFPSDEISTGQFLLAPGVSYPLHSHAASEVYHCRSGTLRLQHGVDGEPFEITPGSYSITPSHRLHALEVIGDPVLLSYIWIGEMTAPNWWWSQDEESGGWQRTAWTRIPGEPWKPGLSEPVTDEIMTEAHP